MPEVLEEGKNLRHADIHKDMNTSMQQCVF